MTAMMPIFYLSLWLSFAAFLVPVLAGFVGLFLHAAGYFPALGAYDISFDV